MGKLGKDGPWPPSNEHGGRISPKREGSLCTSVFVVAADGLPEMLGEEDFPFGKGCLVASMLA